MKYKALMVDVDDTIVPLGLKNLPSQKITDAIAKARKRIHVCIVTARTLESSRNIFSHLQLSGPCVLNNGAQIYDPTENKVLHEIPLSNTVIHEIISVCKQQNIKMLLNDEEKNILYSGTLPKKVLGVYIPEVEIHQIDSLVEKFKSITGITVEKLQSWNKNYLAISIADAHVSKLHGIVEVAKILGITTEEIIGVGDGYNDFPLLMACGLKIAMGNAVPELKAIADFIAPTVDEDGVATVIEKFILTR
jgi:HAD superfamily hydrolase (TIGR01484 family)